MKDFEFHSRFSLYMQKCTTRLHAQVCSFTGFCKQNLPFNPTLAMF